MCGEFSCNPAGFVLRIWWFFFGDVFIEMFVCVLRECERVSRQGKNHINTKVSHSSCRTFSTYSVRCIRMLSHSEIQYRYVHLIDKTYRTELHRTLGSNRRQQHLPAVHFPSPNTMCHTLLQLPTCFESPHSASPLHSGSLSLRAYSGYYVVVVVYLCVLI